MNDLIERIEAASGPDRELDHEIYEYLGSPVVRMVSATTHGTDLVNWAPFYTASVDAALTLVPEGFEWSLEYQAGHHVSSDVECMIAIAKLGDPCRDWEATAATPALALCAAALKARAYLKETNNAD